MSLDAFFTPDRPFGPANQIDINDYRDQLGILEFPDSFFTVLDKEPQIIIGRKGSGKSSIFSCYLAPRAELRQRLDAQHPVTGVRKTADICLSIDTARSFAKMVDAVATLTRRDGGAPVFVENIENDWAEMIFQEVLLWILDDDLNSAGHGRNGSALAALKRLLEGRASEFDFHDTDRVGLLRKTRDIRRQVLQELMGHLQQSRSRLIIIFDNLDEYELDNERFLAVFKGFLRCVSRFDYHVRKYAQNFGDVKVMLSLPEEACFKSKFSGPIYSVDPIKDFGFDAVCHLDWRVREIWSVMLHRYRTFLEVHDPATFRKVEALNVFDNADRRMFLRMLFPFDRIENGLGTQEDPVAYITRHTYLLPRHFVFILNPMARRSAAATHSFREFTPQAVTEAVRDAEERIVDHILTTYERIADANKRFLTNFIKLIPELTHVFTFGEFARKTGRLKEFGDTYEILRSLYSMGLIGEVELGGRDGGTGGARPAAAAGQQAGYLYTRFYFTQAREPALDSKGYYAFHPVFSGRYGIGRRRELGKARPAGQELIVYPIWGEDVRVDAV